MPPIMLPPTSFYSPPFHAYPYACRVEGEIDPAVERLVEQARCSNVPFGQGQVRIASGPLAEDHCLRPKRLEDRIVRRAAPGPDDCTNVLLSYHGWDRLVAYRLQEEHTAHVGSEVS